MPPIRDPGGVLRRSVGRQWSICAPRDGVLHSFVRFCHPGDSDMEGRRTLISTGHPVGDEGATPRVTNHYADVVFSEPGRCWRMIHDGEGFRAPDVRVELWRAPGRRRGPRIGGPSKGNVPFIRKEMSCSGREVDGTAMRLSRRLTLVGACVASLVLGGLVLLTVVAGPASASSTRPRVDARSTPRSVGAARCAPRARPAP